MIKYFRFSFEYVLWGISWPNLLLLLKSIPSHKSEPAPDAVAKEVDGIDELAKFLGDID